jgi:hypothetical protein
VTGIPGFLPFGDAGPDKHDAGIAAKRLLDHAP